MSDTGTLVGQQLPVHLQSATGRGYLRGAVTLVEHAAVLLDRLPDEEIEAVPPLVARIERALEAIRIQCHLEATRTWEPAAAPKPAPKSHRVQVFVDDVEVPLFEVSR